jgi:hypothetical protein
MKIRPVEDQLLLADKQYRKSDGYDEANCRFWLFCERALKAYIKFWTHGTKQQRCVPCFKSYISLRYNNTRPVTVTTNRVANFRL